MTSHLQDDELSAVVELALGIGPLPETPPVDWKILEHLASCKECREEVSELSAIVAGEEIETTIPEGRVVDFVPATTPDYLLPEETEELLAAAHEEPSAIAHFEAAGQQTLQSADDQVQLSVRFLPADHSCRVYPAVVGTIEPSEVAFLMPPGVVCPWPSRSYFRYPGEAYEAVDWKQVKLIYPSSSNLEDSGEDPG